MSSVQKMEDTQTLLMMVLRQHFRDRPQILDEALHIIKEYSSQDSTEEQYEKTVKILREKMNDLPINILLYFLNMVPLPKQMGENFKSSVTEEVQNNSEVDNIRSKLVEYLNSKIPPLVQLKKDQERKTSLTGDFLHVNENSTQFVRPKRTWRRRGKSRQNGETILPHFESFLNKTNNKSHTHQFLFVECKALLDICAEYVVKNQNKLKNHYKTKKDLVWKMVNSNKYDSDNLTLLYDVLKDLNKKEKWMRMVDSDDTCQEVILEEYGNSEVFLRERHVYATVTEDPFEVSDVLRDAVVNFIDN